MAKTNQTRKYLILDYETRSKADLRRCGAYEYARHPSTRILCAAYRVGTRKELPNMKAKLWRAWRESPPKDLIIALRNPDITCVAHNAFFEQVITRYVLPKHL